MKRPILWTVLFMICGIYMRLGVSKLICLVSFLFIVLSAFRFVIKEKEPRYLLLLLFVAFGFFSASYHWEAGTEMRALTGMVEGEGVIREAGVTASGNQKLTLLCDWKDAAGNTGQKEKVYALLMGEKRLAEGMRVRFSGEWKPFSGQTYPGGYDEKLYLVTKGYQYKLYLEDIEVIGEDTSLSSAILRARAAFHTVLDKILPAEESGMMKAMLTGEKEDIPAESYQLYTKAGVVHVLCISGLHMSILAMYTAFFVEKILRRSQRTAAMVTIFTVLAFLLFIGPSPSACRAAAMTSVVMLGRVLYRVPDQINDIALAALLILVIEPLYLFHAGFQLSFITVIGIWLGVGRIPAKKKKERGHFDWLKNGFLVSFYASLFSYPVVAYYFSSVSLAGLAANLLIVPLSGLLLGFGLLSAFLGAIWLPAGVFAAGSVYAILQIFKTVCAVLTQLPFAYILTGCPSALCMLLYYAMLLWFLECGKKKGGWRIGAALSAALFCAVFENPLFRKENTIAFLDVGQGDAAVLSTYDGKAFLMDGGGQFGKDLGNNVGARVVLPYLEYLGISELEGIFLSHPDSDHMTGILEVLESVPTKGLYLSDAAFIENTETQLLKETVEKYQVPLYNINAGDSSEAGEFFCLYPEAKISLGAGDKNQGSAVLRYTYGGVRTLFTGDISAREERFLLQQGADVSAEILKVAHHGSKYSSDAAFLRAVSPRIAVISCGENNLYGHPHEETLQRLGQSATTIFRTDQEGSILVTIGREGTVAVKTMAERKPLYEGIKEKLAES